MPFLVISTPPRPLSSFGLSPDCCQLLGDASNMQGFSFAHRSLTYALFVVALINEYPDVEMKNQLMQQSGWEIASYSLYFE